MFGRSPFVLDNLKQPAYGRLTLTANTAEVLCEEEAVALANDSIYRLAASVWTNSLSRTLRISSLLRVGMVSVNTRDALSPMTPYQL